MGDTSNRTASPVIHFHEGHFTYDAARRGFFLAEPDTLLGDRITRVDVMEFHGARGWELVTTVKLEDVDALGVIDVDRRQRLAWHRRSIEMLRTGTPDGA